MFLHLVPKILHPMGNLCTLDSVSVPELSLRLTGNDLVAMRPYPNKQYLVGMLKGRRALNGFLVKSPRAFEEFTMVSVWNIEGFGKITHTLKTFVEDTDYDLVSHDVLLAQGSYRAQASEQCRVHPVYKNIGRYTSNRRWNHCCRPNPISRTMSVKPIRGGCWCVRGMRGLRQ